MTDLSVEPNLLAYRLPADRHIWMTGGHVSCIIHLPEVIKTMVAKVKAGGKE